jgi:hypothetical protein
MDLDDPIALALAIAEALRAEGFPHALYGGLLLAAYGEARETRDVDIAMAHADAPSVVTVLGARLGLRTIPAFERRVFGGLFVSRITLVEGEELNTLDLVEPCDAAYATRALERAVESSLRSRPIRVLTAEDFVLFKLLSTRERDLADAESVTRSLGSDLERELIEDEVRRLAAASASGLDVDARWRRVLDGTGGAD